MYTAMSTTTTTTTVMNDFVVERGREPLCGLSCGDILTLKSDDSNGTRMTRHLTNKEKEETMMCSSVTVTENRVPHLATSKTYF
jgi:hypothetical protein